MRVTRNELPTTAGAANYFTGAVYVDRVAEPTEESPIQAISVHFTPGSRSSWHTHPYGQTVFVTEGIGLVQSRGAPIVVLRPGDRAYFEPGEEHWQGAPPNRFMTHLAIALVAAGDSAKRGTWGERVTDEEYAAAPPLC